jgi:hypothetical protein
MCSDTKRHFGRPAFEGGDENGREVSGRLTSEISWVTIFVLVYSKALP